VHGKADYKLVAKNNKTRAPMQHCNILRTRY